MRPNTAGDFKSSICTTGAKKNNFQLLFDIFRLFLESPTTRLLIISMENFSARRICVVMFINSSLFVHFILRIDKNFYVSSFF